MVPIYLMQYVYILSMNNQAPEKEEKIDNARGRIELLPFIINFGLKALFISEGAAGCGGLLRVVKVSHTYL